MNYKKTPISLLYHLKVEFEVIFCKSHFECLKVDVERAGFIFENSYLKDKLNGSLPDLFLRKSLFLRLKEVSKKLDKSHKLFIFDGFRTLETQKHLFDNIFKHFNKIYPEKSKEQTILHVEEFVSNPYNKDKFPLPLHNSGGAVDLAIYDCNQKKLLNFGSPFDNLDHLSHTVYFEKNWTEPCKFTKKDWNEIQENRRYLFNVMKDVGFTNYSHEWWHYDMGDCLWAKTLKTNWFYESMEDEVLEDYL
jgi:D-alanyl-D-alanine dipeptidase